MRRPRPPADDRVDGAAYRARVTTEPGRTSALRDFRAGVREGQTEAPAKGPGRMVQATTTAVIDVAMSLLFGMLLVRDTSFLPQETDGWIVAGLLLAPGVVQRLWIGLRWPADSEADSAKMWIKIGALAVTLAIARAAVSSGIPPNLAAGAVASRLIGLTAYQRHRPPAFFWGLAGGIVVSILGWGLLASNHNVSLFSGQDASVGTVIRDVVALLAIVTAFGIIGAQVRRESEEATRIEQALAAERARIARELHDVVAHQMTAVILQAQGAAAVIESDPGRATAALRSIEDGSRAALVEMRRLLGVLREGEEAFGSQVVDERRSAPQPTLRDLPELIRSHGAGLPGTGRTQVRLGVGDGADLAPVGVQTSAHRIVQEALTNIARHAGRVSVDVGVRVERDDLVVRVVNEAPVTPPTTRIIGAGLGLRGMRERAEALGGTLRAGATDDGGWEVEAVLPLHPSSGQTADP